MIKFLYDVFFIYNFSWTLNIASPVFYLFIKIFFKFPRRLLLFLNFSILSEILHVYLLQPVQVFPPLCAASCIPFLPPSEA